MSNYYYFGEGYITQLISQYYSPTYDPCCPDISRKYINYLDKQYIFEIYNESLQEEYSAIRAQQIRNCDCLMFIIDTRIQSNNMIESIENYSEQVERTEKLMLFSIVIGFEDEDKRKEMLKELELYKLKLQYLQKNNYCKFIFTICNLNFYNDTLDIANNIVKNCVENNYEINYLKLMNDIIYKKKIDKTLQKTTINNGKENKDCYLM
ncbi:hypothetical protein ABK040_002321 [Willaertia magna]